MTFPTFEDFINEYKKYQKFLDSSSAKAVFNFLREEDNVFRLINSNNNGKNALFGVLPDLESDFQNRSDFDFNEGFVKQCVGSMIKFILGQFGYHTTAQRDMPKGSFTYFTSSMRYEYREGTEKFKLVQKFEIVPIDNSEQQVGEL